MSLLADLFSSLLDLFVWIGGVILRPLGAQRALGAAYPPVAVLFGVVLMGGAIWAAFLIAVAAT